MPSVAKLQAGLKSETSTASSYPGVDPNYSTLPAMAGEEYKYQWLNPTESITAPEATIEGVRQAGVGGDQINSPREKPISITAYETSISAR